MIKVEVHSNAGCLWHGTMPAVPRQNEEICILRGSDWRHHIVLRVVWFISKSGKRAHVHVR